jgi:hypothetical protein
MEAFLSPFNVPGLRVMEFRTLFSRRQFYPLHSPLIRIWRGGGKGTTELHTKAFCVVFA